MVLVKQTPPYNVVAMQPYLPPCSSALAPESRAKLEAGTGGGLVDVDDEGR